MKPARTKPRPAAVATLAIGVALGLTSADALAQPGRAKAHAPSANGAAPEAADDAKLRSGISLFNKGRDQKRALAELERLYATTKKPRALYWIGRVHEKSGQAASALTSFKRYEREGGTLTPATQRDVTERIQTLTMQVAAVTVTAPAGSSISLDDVVVGTAPLADPLFVDPGKHAIAVKEGESKTIEVGADSRLAVELSAAAAHTDEPAAPVVASPSPAATPVATASSEVQAAAAPTSSPNAEAPAHGPSTALTVGGVGLAALLAAGSVYFSIKTADSSHDIAAMKSDSGASRAEVADMESKIRLQAGVAVGLGVAAAVTAGATFIVYRISSSKDQSTRVVSTGNGLSLVGRF